MEIIQINNHTWRIEDEYAVRFFLLEGEKKALLIDSGMEIHNAKEIAQKLTTLPIELINTHTDVDHIGSPEEFETFYMHSSDAVSYYNMKGMTNRYIPVEDGEIIDLGNRPLKILLIPGHTPGSIAILDMNSRVLYSGDSVQDGTIYMFGPMRNMFALINSLKKLQGFKSEFDTIYPCHGSFPVSADQIDAVLEGAHKVLGGECPYEEVELYGQTVRQYDAGTCGFYIDN